MQNRDDIIYLWNEAFGDSSDEISDFLSVADDDGILTFSENGRVVSQLFLLKGSLVCGDNSASAYYLYAAATLASHRGRGIMSELIGRAVEKAKAENVGYILLFPAEEGLYGFYEKFGFIPACKALVCEIDTENITEPKINEYTRFTHDRRIYSYAEKMYSSLGCKVLQSEDSSMIYSENEGTVTVREWRGLPHLGKLADETGCKRIVIRLPVGTEINGKCRKVTHGMILPLKGDIPDNCFLDYTLD